MLTTPNRGYSIPDLAENLFGQLKQMIESVDADPRLVSGTFTVNDAITNTFTDILTLGHNSTGTPAAGLGGSILFNLETSTTPDQNAARIGAVWTTATHATRSSAFVIQAMQNAAALVEVARFEYLQVTFPNASISAGSLSVIEASVTGGLEAGSLFSPSLDHATLPVTLGHTGSIVEVVGDISAGENLNVGGDAFIEGSFEAFNITASGDTASDFTVTDAVTNVFTDIVDLSHNSSGTPAANFGGSIRFGLESSTTADQNAARIGALWTTATHASRTSAFVIQAVNNAGALATVATFAGIGDLTIARNLLLPEGGVINWNAGDVTLTHAANALAFAGASSGYTFDAPLIAGTFATDSGAGSILITGPTGELDFVRRGLTSWPGTPAAGDRIVWYVTSDGSWHTWTDVTGDIFTLAKTGAISSVTGASLTAGGTWTNNPSWRALKSNIEPVAPDESAMLLDWLREEFQPVRYRYKAENEGLHLGFLLDDMPENVRQIVTAGDPKGGISTKDSEGLLLLLVKELAREVQQLKERMN